MNKKKIFNDPVYGLISFKHDTLYRVIDHPYFQRLRRITQQALSHYVYPGALHTRFQHALGALHLMTTALETLRSKGVEISDEEYEATCVAILLHDVGHGPFSHALEQSIVDFHHEEMSLNILDTIGRQLNKDFSLARDIFKNYYHRPFLHELVSGQLDMDRVDYLNRDSYFSGVAEGVIGYDRIIKMLQVRDNHLVVEEKGIYSVEMFLMARKTMYLQVYLHKTVVAAEQMLKSILSRMKFLLKTGIPIKASDALLYFLDETNSIDTDRNMESVIRNFVHLDDTDILHAIKSNINHEDRILSRLCGDIMDRRLFKVYTGSPDALIAKQKVLRDKICSALKIAAEETDYFQMNIQSNIPVYTSGKDEIKILMKNGKIKNFSKLFPRYKDFNENKCFLVAYKV
jgi:uncharacterized protein